MNGLVAAVVTPMDLDGELNLGLVPRIAAHLEGIGISGVYIAGSTGEGMSLTDDERRAVAEAYVESCRGKMHTVVQVGHNSMKAAAALAAHAEAIAPPGRVPATVGVVIEPAGQLSALKLWCAYCSWVRWRTVEAPLAA